MGAEIVEFEEMTGKINRDLTVGFVKIKDLGDAQQTTVSLRTLMHIGRLCEVLEKLGFETVTITVEKDRPMLIGKKDIGIVIANVEEE